MPNDELSAVVVGIAAVVFNEGDALIFVKNGTGLPERLILLLIDCEKLPHTDIERDIVGLIDCEFDILLESDKEGLIVLPSEGEGVLVDVCVVLIEEVKDCVGFVDMLLDLDCVTLDVNDCDELIDRVIELVADDE